MMNDLICGAGTVVTAVAATEGLQLNWWESILVAVVSALVYSILNVGSKILTSWLERKGYINHDQRKKIDHKMDDLADDGKLNDSVPEEKEDEEDKQD